MSDKLDLNALRDEMMRANGRFRAINEVANEAQISLEMLLGKVESAREEYRLACDRYAAAMDAAKESK